MNNFQEIERGRPETEMLEEKGLAQVLQGKGWEAKKGLLAGVAFLIVLTGVGTGYFWAKRAAGEGVIAPGEGSEVKKGVEVGSVDFKTFRDTAVGILEKGGIDGEGTHKLIREGGPSQTAYLTSSVVDLDQFVGRKVKIWGETFKAQKAGWLMDVGRIKVLE